MIEIPDPTSVYNWWNRPVALPITRNPGSHSRNGTFMVVAKILKMLKLITFKMRNRVSTST